MIKINEVINSWMSPVPFSFNFLWVTHSCRSSDKLSHRVWGGIIGKLSFDEREQVFVHLIHIPCGAACGGGVCCHRLCPTPASGQRGLSRLRLTEPIFEADHPESQVVARGEALIVHRNAVIERLAIDGVAR